MTNDKQRERLVELIKIYPCMSTAEDCFMESIATDFADYLLTNGIIVPPCNVGDKIYREMVYNGKLVEWDIVKMEVFADEIGFVDDSDNYFSAEDIGKSVFLTREEAEQALRKEDEGK